MHYLRKLEKKQQDQIKNSIEELLQQYQGQPVGNGYIDIILSRANAVSMIRALEKLPVAVVYVTWWCHVTPENRQRLNCPHGLGGPRNEFGHGWFSECDHYPDFSVKTRGLNIADEMLNPAGLATKCSRLVCDYLENELPSEDFFSECLHPGLWLCMPPSWKRFR